MMHAVLRLGACLLLTASAKDEHTDGWCVLDGAEAINEAMDAAVYAWAASQRCTPAALKANNVVKCEIDIATAAESVNRMINVILRSVNECGAIKSESASCGMAAGRLTAHFAGMSAASGGIVQECANDLQKKHSFVMRDALRKNGAGLPLTDPRWPQGEQLTCAVDIKGGMNQVFQVAADIAQAQKNCDKKDHKCSYDAIEIISSLSGLGKYILGTIDHCQSGVPTAIKNFPLTCSEHIANLVREVTGFISDTDALAADCGLRKHKPAPPKAKKPPGKKIILTPVYAKAPRLYSESTYPYEESGKKDCKGADCLNVSHLSASNTLLIALLPISAVVGFTSGMRLYRRAGYDGYQQSRDMELTPEE